MASDLEFILTLSCRDTQGIVHAVSGVLALASCNILDSQQFGDVQGDDATGLFFMRVHFAAPPHLADADTLTRLFDTVRQQFGMEARIHSAAYKPRVLVMVSTHGHCFNDLLFRIKSGQLHAEVPAVVSNHPTFAGLSASHGVPFYHLPLPTGSSLEAKRAQEQQIEP